MIRTVVAAALLTLGAGVASAAIGEPVAAFPPMPADYPRPMPTKLPPPNLADFWHSFGEWLQPKLGQALPNDLWI